MPALRWLLVVGCVTAVAVAAGRAAWQGRLTCDNHTWLLDLGRHPVWRPPPTPGYERFRQEFAPDTSGPLPRPDRCVIRADCDPVEVGAEAAFGTWAAAAACGLLYFAGRGRRRDFVLHVAGSAAAGAAVAAVACVGLWCVAGGWGPPVPVCFTAVGLVAGWRGGVASFSGPPPDDGRPRPRTLFG